MTADTDKDKELSELIESLKESCHAREVHVMRPTAPDRMTHEIDVYTNVLVYPESSGAHFLYELDTGTLLIIDGVFKVVMHDRSAITYLKILKKATVKRDISEDDGMVR